MARAALNHAGHIDVETKWLEKELIKQIPGSAFDGCGIREWCVPLSWASCVILRGVFGDTLEIDPELDAWAKNEIEARVGPASAIRKLTEPVDGMVRVAPNLDTESYPFQAVGSDFLVLARDALLGDDLGTGKTIQALTAIRKIQTNPESGYDPALPALVICPNAVKTHWEVEAHRWLPEATPYVVKGGAVGRRKILEAAHKDPTALVVVSIETVRLMSRLAPFGSIKLKRCLECDKKRGENIRTTLCEVHPKELNTFGFKTVVVDEAHRIGEPKSKQTRAMWAVMHGSTVTRRWALTGTSIMGHPGHLWSVMHGVSPNEYPTKSKFVDRYCLSAWNNFGGLDIVGIRPDTKEEFFKFFDPRFRRMPKELVLTQLPPKVRLTRYVQMTPKQAKAYAEISAKMMTEMEDGQLLVTTDSLVMNTRLVQFASSYAELVPSENENELPRVLLKEPSPKLDELEELLDGELLGHQVAVCANSRQLIDMAAARLTKRKISFAMIVGGMSDWERDSNLAEFQSGGAQVMLFTTQAGGVGLTMTAADTLVRLQRSWSMVDEIQAEGRVYRIGSERHKSVSIIEIVTEGTVEVTKQLPNFYAKLHRLEEINRDRLILLEHGKDTSELDAEEFGLKDSYLW